MRYSEWEWYRVSLVRWMRLFRASGCLRIRVNWSSSGQMAIRWDTTMAMRKIRRVLMQSGNPPDTEKLRLDKEVREIERQIAVAGASTWLELRSKWAVRIDDLQGHLLREKPNILHFSSHGAESGSIILEDELGLPYSVPNSALARLMKLIEPRPECVVLNCCYSEDQASTIALSVKYVVGTKSSIGDQGAIEFSSAFYRAVAYGESYRNAFDLAVNQLELKDDMDSSIFSIHIGGMLMPVSSVGFP